MLLLCLVFREQTTDADVTEISRDIAEAKEAQDKANNDLQSVSRDSNTNEDQIQEVNM